MIRTTLKHPFFTNDRGWVPVKELHPGDWILTASGNWIAVEEVYDTGDWELVYNVRVADHHTYFVEDEAWGWSAWAHNVYTIFSGLKVAESLKTRGLSAALAYAVDQQILKDGAYGDQVALTSSLTHILTEFGNATDLQTRLTKEIDRSLTGKKVQLERAAFYAALPGDFQSVLNSRYGGIDARGMAYPGPHMTLANGSVSHYVTHAHHIVFKKGNGPAQQRVSLEAQDVLMYYSIDPFFGQEVLVWAPNHGHNLGTLQYARDELYTVYEAGQGRDRIVEKLRALGVAYIG